MTIFRRFASNKTEPETLSADPELYRRSPREKIEFGLCIAAGIAVVLFVPNFFGSLLSSAPTVGQPTVISMPEASPTAIAEPSTQTRDESWNRLKASVTALEQTTIDLDAQLRAARAQRWLLFAANRCQELGTGGCSSPRSLLLDYYLGSSAAIQNRIRTGQIQVDSLSVKEWREKTADLRDMAQALSLDITGTQPVPFVATADVSAAIDGVFTDAAKFDSLRQQQQQQQFEKPQASQPTPSPAPIQEGRE